MKKTFFLSVALLAGLASADELTYIGGITVKTSDGNVDTWNLSEELTDGVGTHYAYIALLNVSEFSEALTNSSLNGYKIFSHDNANFGVGVMNDGTMVFNNTATGSALRGTNYAPVSDTVTLDSSLLTNNGSALAGAALTFAVGSNNDPKTNGIAGISLRYQDGSTVDIYGTNSTYRASSYTVDALTSLAGLVDSIAVYQGTSTDVASIEHIATAAQSALSASVPEPATATLSLLALAGLAARRRRH